MTAAGPVAVAQQVASMACYAMFAMLLPIWQDCNSDLEFSTDEDGSQSRRRLPTSLASGGHFFPPKVKALRFFGTPVTIYHSNRHIFPEEVYLQQHLYENRKSFRPIFFSRISSVPPGWASRAVATLVLTLSLPIPDLFIQFNRAPRFSCSGAQVYRIGSLHPPRHPVIAFVLRDTIKGTRFLICTIGLYFSCFHNWVSSDYSILCYYTDQEDRGSMFLPNVGINLLYYLV